MHADAGATRLETLWQIHQDARRPSSRRHYVSRGIKELSPSRTVLPGHAQLGPIQADLVNFSGANETALWTNFAQHGMGGFAGGPRSRSSTRWRSFSGAPRLRHLGVRHDLLRHRRRAG